MYIEIHFSLHSCSIVTVFYFSHTGRSIVTNHTVVYFSFPSWQMRLTIFAWAYLLSVYPLHRMSLYVSCPFFCCIWTWGWEADSKISDVSKMRFSSWGTAFYHLLCSINSNLSCYTCDNLTPPVWSGIALVTHACSTRKREKCFPGSSGGPLVLTTGLDGCLKV